MAGSPNQVIVKYGTNSALVPPLAAQKMVSVIRSAMIRAIAILAPSGRPSVSCSFAKGVRFPFKIITPTMATRAVTPPTEMSMLPVICSAKVASPSWVAVTRGEDNARLGSTGCSRRHRCSRTAASDQKHFHCSNNAGLPSRNSRRSFRRRLF